MNDGVELTRNPYPSPVASVKMHEVIYWSDGLRVKGLLAEPAEEGIYDAFLYLRGGIKGVGMVRPSRIAQFAQQGFVVFAPYYRGNRGGEGNEDFAGEDRHDVFSAAAYLRDHPSVNGRLHIFGFSRGGVMALQAAVELEHVTSLVTWGGVSDMELTYDERKDMRRMMKRVIGGSPKTQPESYKWRTPLYDAERIQCPVLIIHGVLDTNVTFEHALRLENRLKELGKHCETWYYEHFDHNFPPLENLGVVRKLTTWMKQQKGVNGHGDAS
ncbi:alpha/beta hydrolase family protein [Jeotgalibacillus aurantiacus]|uniref:alpha/beta hydrolase family protein n=1 Tax=Jeotgalibacillus aurantiacus TaxID=2763266 RepID=UPI001D0BC9F2|nr:prolyl oligopeptidase family serine peptidase [Jeotgalibacillus aurantiacus]